MLEMQKIIPIKKIAFNPKYQIQEESVKFFTSKQIVVVFLKSDAS